MMILKNIWTFYFDAVHQFDIVAPVNCTPIGYQPCDPIGSLGFPTWKNGTKVGKRRFKPTYSMSLATRSQTTGVSNI